MRSGYLSKSISVVCAREMDPAVPGTDKDVSGAFGGYSKQVTYILNNLHAFLDVYEYFSVK